MANLLGGSSNLSLKRYVCTCFAFLIMIQLSAPINSDKVNQSSSNDLKQYEEKVLARVAKTNHESDAINILNECIYKNMKFSNNQILETVSKKRWIKASRLIIDFLTILEKKEDQENLKSQIHSLVKDSEQNIDFLRSILQLKKKNIIRISPVFEWSQDNEFIKIRLKFAKNLESPGEKDIQNFKMNCTRTHLTVHGYKDKEDYLTYYYRRIHLYDFMRFMTCEGYKETDGTYIIKFMKNQATLYWNFLDQIGDDHHNTYTWFDVFTAYDDKARYTSFREWAMENLYLSDIDDYVKDNMEEKTRRLNRIKNSLNYLKTKDYENKNFCNSPVHDKYCIISDIHDWNYWLF